MLCATTKVKADVNMNSDSGNDEPDCYERLSDATSQRSIRESRRRRNADEGNYAQVHVVWQSTVVEERTEMTDRELEGFMCERLPRRGDEIDDVESIPELADSETDSDSDQMPDTADNDTDRDSDEIDVDDDVESMPELADSDTNSDSDQMPDTADNETDSDSDPIPETAELPDDDGGHRHVLAKVSVWEKVEAEVFEAAEGVTEHRHEQTVSTDVLPVYSSKEASKMSFSSVVKQGKEEGIFSVLYYLVARALAPTHARLI